MDSFFVEVGTWMIVASDAVPAPRECPFSVRSRFSRLEELFGRVAPCRQAAKFGMAVSSGIRRMPNSIPTKVPHRLDIGQRLLRARIAQGMPVLQKMGAEHRPGEMGERPPREPAFG